MHPTGHFISTAILSGGVYAATQSVPLTAGCFVGGFLIDLDHYFDYVVINRQSDLRPKTFLDYYMKNRFDWIVLPLHAYELFAVLAVVAYWWRNPWLIGYLIGATMHMGLDLIFNAPVAFAIIPFYSFIYRAWHGFAKEKFFRLNRDAAASEKKSSG